MTAPTLMPAAPAMPPSSGVTGSAATGTGDPSPAFASALDSALDQALTGSGNTGSQQAGTAGDDETSGDDESRPDDASTLPVATLQPGLWALLSAVHPLPGATPGTVTPDGAEAGAELIGAVTTTSTAVAAAAVQGQAPASTPSVAGAAPPAPATTGDVPTVPATTAGVSAAAAFSLVAAAPAARAATPAARSAEPAARAAEPAARPAVPAPPSTTSVATEAGPDAVASGTTGAFADVLLPSAAAGNVSDGDGLTPDNTSDDTSSAPAAATAPVAEGDPVFSMTTAAAVSNAAVVATAEPTTGSDAPVAAQLGRQLAVLTNAPDGSQTMTLVITPDDLGPVSIQATVTDGNLELMLHGAHEHGRHALTEALPELRRDLEAAGISVSRLEVGADAGGDSDPWAGAAQQQLADSQNGQQSRPGQPGHDLRSQAVTRDHPGEGTVARTSDLSAPSGVDVRV